MGKSKSSGEQTKQPSLRSLRARHEAAQLQQELMLLEHQNRLLEGVSPGSTWGGVVGFSEKSETADTALTPIENLDRRLVDSVGSYVTHIQILDYIRSQSRILREENTFAINIYKSMRNYVVGEGITCTVTSKEEEKKRNKKIMTVAQDIIDEFYEENQLIEREDEVLDRLLTEGEVFLRHYPDSSTGIDKVRFIEPEQIRPKSTDRTAPEWTWGIRNAVYYKVPSGEFVESRELEQKGLLEGYVEEYNSGSVSRRYDRETIVSYGVSSGADDSTDWEEVDALFIDSMKINTPRNIKRGLPDFWPVGKALEDVAKLVRNLRIGASVQASIMGFVEYERANDTTVGQLISSQTERTTVVPAGSGGTARTVSQVRTQPGTIKHLPKGTTYKATPFWSQNSVNHVTIVQASLRAIGVAWEFPEYMMTGSAENANYASTLVAGAPFIREVLAWQKMFKAFYSRMLWKVLKFAYDSDRFKAEGIKLQWEAIKKIIHLQMEAPVPEIKSEVEKAQIDDVDIRNKVMSRKTRRLRRNLDDEVEDRNINEEAKEDAAMAKMMAVAGAAAAPGASPLGKRPATGAMRDTMSIKRSGLKGNELDNSVQEGIYINMPGVRQETSYSCGAACVKSVMDFYGITIDEERLRAVLGSDPSVGTDMSVMNQYLSDSGIAATMYANAGIRDIKLAMIEEHPVIVCFQAWGTPEQYANNKSGHYAIIVGFNDSGFFFEDPAMPEGKRGFLEYDEFVSRWHDVDSVSHVCNHYMIEVVGGEFIPGPVGRID